MGAITSVCCDPTEPKDNINVRLIRDPKKDRI